MRWSSVYVSEIFPTHIRSKGMALSISGYFLSLLIYLQASPTAFADIQWRYVPNQPASNQVLTRDDRFYIVFLVALTFFIIPTFFYYPETKNIPLEEINRLFGDDTAHVNLYSPETADEKEAREVMHEDVTAAT
jgi:MFS family permease